MSDSSSTIRSRFAPSPTGYLHLGSARTALFAWAYARHFGGKFILRVEDTDVERSTPAAVKAIFDAMTWLELDYDEGPFFQMQRMDRYSEVLAQMLAAGQVYHCYMTPAELDALRAEQTARGDKPRYDGRWRPEKSAGKTPPPGVKPVLRFRNPDNGVVAWDDGVKGRIEISNAEMDDLVIARPDGTPTYNFCVVVDDIDMRITHVIRGDDHVNNTPRQINMFRALGAEPPSYAHVPTVLGEDGAKLSKRHGAMGVMEYEAQGYLPEALINFLARIGWGHGDEEIFTREQLVQWFDLPGISPAPSRFNADKLKWVNQEHMKRLPEADLGKRLVPFLARAGLDPVGGPDAGAVATLLRDRADTLVAMADAAHYFYAAPTVAPEKIAELVTPAIRPALVELQAEFAAIEWTREALLGALKAAAVRHGLKPPQIMMALRMVVAGTTSTPAIDAVLALLGRDTTRKRMATGLGGKANSE
ncbi:MAG: glutamate--tRNA ligase [Betaproteobacteria bacterium]